MEPVNDKKPWKVACPDCRTVWSFATEDEAADFHDKHFEETRTSDGPTHDSMTIDGPPEGKK